MNVDNGAATAAARSAVERDAARRAAVDLELEALAETAVDVFSRGLSALPIVERVEVMVDRQFAGDPRLAAI